MIILLSNSSWAHSCRAQFSGTIFEPANKVALVTGATFGIGKETALGIAKTGATVVIVGRSPEKTIQTVAWLKKQSGNEKIHYLLADLSVMSEVKELSDKFKSQYPKLDILVNNAGAIFASREMTKERIEMTWALNHLSPMLLTISLQESLVNAGNARVVNVASALYEKGQMDFDQQQMQKKYNGFKVYGDSKLANVLSTFYLARKFAGTGITVNCLHPGFVDTGIGTNSTGIYKLLVTALIPVKKLIMATSNMMISPEQGAQTSIFLASSDEIAGVTGQYFFQNKVQETTPQSRDEKLQERVWEYSLSQINQVLGLTIN